MHTNIHTFLNKLPVSLIRSVLWQGKRKRIVYRTCFFLEHITKQGWHTLYAFHPTASKFPCAEQSKCICTITGGEQREYASKLSASWWWQLLHFTEPYRFYTQSGGDGETIKVESRSRLSILHLVKCGTLKAVLSCGLEAENRSSRYSSMVELLPHTNKALGLVLSTTNTEPESENDHLLSSNATSQTILMYALWQGLLYPKQASNLLCTQRWPWIPASGAVLWSQVWPTHLGYAELGIEPKVLCILDKYSTNCAVSPPLILQASLWFII